MPRHSPARDRGSRRSRSRSRERDRDRDRDRDRRDRDRNRERDRDRHYNHHGGKGAASAASAGSSSSSSSAAAAAAANVPGSRHKRAGSRSPPPQHQHQQQHLQPPAPSGGLFSSGTAIGGAPVFPQPEPRPMREEDFAGKTEEEIGMMQLMGFCGFGTTKGKQVANNDIYVAHIVKKRKYRQYMNRRGGFNRPLDAVN